MRRIQAKLSNSVTYLLNGRRSGAGLEARLVAEDAAARRRARVLRNAIRHVVWRKRKMGEKEELAISGYWYWETRKISGRHNGNGLSSVID